MSIAVLILVSAVVSGLVYFGHGEVVRIMHRNRIDGDDPIKRAYARELAGVEQTAALLHSGWFFVAFFVGLGYQSILLALLIGIVLGVPVAMWESKRVKSILT